jgi:DNA-binding response OmpR family regulator
MAIVYEGGRDHLAGELERLGWRVRRMPKTEVRALAGDRSDMWVVDPDACGPDPCAFLRGLARLREPMPLLVVADDALLRERFEEQERLLCDWAARHEVVQRPYTPEQLAYRAAKLRFASTCDRDEGGVLVLGALRVDAGTHEASYAGVSLALSPSEFGILLALAEANGRTLSPERIIERLETSVAGDPRAAANVYVCRLRAKLTAAGVPQGAIKSVRGAGYRLDVVLLGAV